MKNDNYHPLGSKASDFRYFDLGRYWNSGIRNIFESAAVQAQLFQDFNKFVKGKEHRLNSDRASSSHVSYSYNQTDKPIRWESCDWRCSRIGRPYSFDEYVCHGACHCIVNSLLLTARIAYPDKPWIIVNGTRHSTVWDQCLTFFDMNYLALKVSPEDCAISTVLDQESIFLEEGELLQLV